MHYYGSDFKPYRESEDNKIVYHYTSPEGFLSIIKNKNLWFSDIQFMNDRSEYVYIKKIFHEAAKGTEHEGNDGFVDYLMGSTYGKISMQYTAKKSSINKIIKMRYYLFCTSLDPDSHSMWNYYVKNGNYQGYNLGLSVNSLIDSISQLGLKLTFGKVNYNAEEQIMQLHDKIIELSKQCDEGIELGIEEDQCFDNYQSELSNYIMQRCMFYKNPAFKHENEYRFLIEAPENNRGKINLIDHHIGGGGLIVPHLIVKFDPIQSLQRITLAPMMEPEVAKQGVQRLLDNKISGNNINYSQIDLRY